MQIILSGLTAPFMHATSRIHHSMSIILVVWPICCRKLP